MQAGLADRIRRAAAELAGAMAAMPRTPVIDPFSAPPDFASLLRESSTTRADPPT